MSIRKKILNAKPTKTLNKGLSNIAKFRQQQLSFSKRMQQIKSKKAKVRTTYRQPPRPMRYAYNPYSPYNPNANFSGEIRGINGEIDDASNAVR